MADTRAPEDAEVYDLDAAINERKGEPFYFRFGGERYEMPGLVDSRALALLMGADIEGALVMLLGDEQWKRMLDAKQILDVEALGDLLQRWAAHSGVDLGNFVSFTDSSKTTVKPSKRTSNGTSRRTSGKSAPRR